MKIKYSLLLASIFVVISAWGQTLSEITQPLSAKAKKGFLEDVTYSEKGNIDVLYKIGGDKNKNELYFELYSFDKDLKFLGSKAVSEPKIESKPDKKVKYLNAWVGGKSSFDVLSMKLKVSLREVNQKWDYKAQRYITSEVINDETIKLKAANDRAYFGVDQYRNEENGHVVVLAYYETKDKKNPKQYVLLQIDWDGNLTEKNLDINGAYSVVFCKEISENAPGKSVGKQDFVVVMAPKKGTADATKYVYLHYDINGTLKNKIEFDSPSSNLLVNSVDVKNGEVYMSALSTKSKDYYDAVFNDYAPIESGYDNLGGDANGQMIKYNKSAYEVMDYLHLLKFSGDKFIFGTTAPVAEFKSKKQIAPGEKGGKIYDGKKFEITSFVVTPADEYLIAGQLISRVNIGDLKNPQFVTGYGDVICFHFDARGALKAQYAIDKVFEDKKSEIFNMPQSFYLSHDGRYAYWEILEVKGYTGYNSFWDAYNNRKTFKGRYFPRITKIDLQAGKLTEFKTPGQKKYFIYHDGKMVNPDSKNITYVGRDENNENLWIAKVTLD